MAGGHAPPTRAHALAPSDLAGETAAPGPNAASRRGPARHHPGGLAPAAGGVLKTQAMRKPARRLPLLASLAFAGSLAAGCDTPHYRSEWGLRPLPTAAPAEGRPIPTGAFEGAERNLLHEYEGREPVLRDEAATWQLPFHAKRVVVALLIMAARDDFSGLDMVVTPGARWGFPDRREFEAAPILGADGGAAFAEALRAVAARFPDKVAFNCPAIATPLQNYVRSGAEPMWCFYMTPDQIDILAFKLVVHGGVARIDYVGMLPQRPDGPVIVRPGRDSPPMTPIMKPRSRELPPMLRPAPLDAVTPPAPGDAPPEPEAPPM